MSEVGESRPHQQKKEIRLADQRVRRLPESQATQVDHHLGIGVGPQSERSARFEETERGACLLRSGGSEQHGDPAREFLHMTGELLDGGGSAGGGDPAHQPRLLGKTEARR
jgi:hypothetical protein